MKKLTPQQMASSIIEWAFAEKLVGPPARTWAINRAIHLFSHSEGKCIGFYRQVIDVLRAAGENRKSRRAHLQRRQARA